MASQNAIGASPTPSTQSSPQTFGASGSEDPTHSAHFNPGQSASEDAQEAKRRRIARACDMCRKKKACQKSILILYLTRALLTQISVYLR